nr:DNA repair protein RAD51 homolog 4-like isoform X1 [Leptinotarsa decemlineata]
MDLLAENVHLLFSSTVVNSLNKKQIMTILDFLNCNAKLIENTCNLTFRDILDIRKELLKKYAARPENAFSSYQYILSHCAIIQTGIINLDQLLEGGLFTGNIYEICGLPSSGKSLFCLTLMKNLASSIRDGNIHYFDTKHDFQAVKFKQMLKHLDKEVMVEVMNHIFIKRSKTKEELLKHLTELKKEVENGSNIKIIVIDSLPPLYFQSFDHTESNSFLNHMVNILRYLTVKFNIIAIVTNLVTLWNEGDFKNINSMKERIACGSYWYNIPNVRLKFNKEDNKCKITITKSRRIMPEVDNCLVEINHLGFIG